MKRATFLIYLLIAVACSCTNNGINKKSDCNTSDLDIFLVSKSGTSGCKAADGRLMVSGLNGQPPYNYSLAGGAYQTSSEFSNLDAGSYSVTVQDANNCTRSIDVKIAATNSTLDAAVVLIPSSQCSSPNGSITMNGIGGNPPYSYLFGTGGFGSDNVFSNLKPGSYSASIKDALDCVKTFSFQIASNTGVKLSTQIKPIIDSNCGQANCHGGNQSPNLTTNSNMISNAARIKARTVARTMPPSQSLTQAQIDLIACWVDDGAPNN
ncbi:MAG: hypothetical protein ACKO13_02110 [Cytophagales bacterium]